jgi:hypothetical protein
LETLRRHYSHLSAVFTKNRNSIRDGFGVDYLVLNPEVYNSHQPTSWMYKEYTDWMACHGTR